MAFTVVDRAQASAQDPGHLLSKLYPTDFRILSDGMAGVGVVSGGAVTAQGSPDMTVAVAAAVIRIASGALVAVSSGNVTVGAADGSNPRIDLISSSNAGVKACTAGTAATNPVPPDLPAGNVALAYVLVPTSDTDIDSDQIVDKRVLLATGYPAQGTTNPASPATGDRFFRSDLGLLIYYDGTRWLTVNEYVSPLQIQDALLPIAGSGTTAAYGPLDNGTYDTWLVRVICSTTVLTTNDGTKYWTVAFARKPGGTSLGSFNTSADTANTNTRHNVTIGALSGTSDRYVDIIPTKTSTPGNIYVIASLVYRLVIT